VTAEPVVENSPRGAPASAPRRIDIPFVIRGRCVKVDGATRDLPHAGASRLVTPRLTREIATELLEEHSLVDVRLQEIVGFVRRVGVQWANDEYARRRLYIRQLRDVVGFSEQMAVAEADLIASALMGMQRLYDTLEVELGSHRILDEWVPRGECEVRAYPRGLFVHLLPGNVPLAAVISLLRSLLTKNATVLKVPARDPVTATSLALSFLDADPSHPVSRALSVLYWPNDDPLGAELVASANGVCVWGGHEALGWAQRTAGTEAEIVRFGPKQSLSVVEIGAADDAARVARGVAHDVCMYDQQACFSTSRVFVVGDRERFVERLAEELQHYDRILPPGRRDLDDEAHVSGVRLHHDVMGSAVRKADNWTIIECGPEDADVHPGARTVFVHPLRALRDLERWVDATTQTVAVHPWERSAEVRDLLARRGVSRIVETGLSGILRVGSVHDGVDPATRFVRLVAVEAGSARHSKGMAIPIDTTEMVEDRQFRDLIL